MANENWNNNDIQFPRLLAEINAVGLTKAQYAFLCTSMDLKTYEIDEILERAEIAFTAIKG